MIDSLQVKDMQKWKDFNRSIRGYAQHLQVLADNNQLKGFTPGLDILDALKYHLVVIGAWRLTEGGKPISSTIASLDEMSAMYHCIKSIYTIECDDEILRKEFGLTV